MTQYFKYIPSGDRPLFNLSGRKKKKKILFCLSVPSSPAPSEVQEVGDDGSVVDEVRYVPHGGLRSCLVGMGVV